MTCFGATEIRRAYELFELAALVGVCDPDHNIPDHSLLSWSVMFDESNIFDYNDLQSHVRTVYDVSQIPMELMCNVQNTQNMNRLINSCTSANINDSYDSFCYLIQNELQSSLPAKKWREKLVSDHAVRGCEEGGNKLRTYRKFGYLNNL